MDMENLKDKIERWKATAEIFLKEDIQAFIKDSSDDLYFCDIILIGENSLTVECFGPEHRKNKKYTLYWPLIVDFDEYKHFEVRS